jgi:hypothetical protein
MVALRPSKLQELRDSVAGAENENRELEETLRLRKQQLANVLRAIEELKSEKEEKQRAIAAQRVCGCVCIATALKRKQRRAVCCGVVCCAAVALWYRTSGWAELRLCQTS